MDDLESMGGLVKEKSQWRYRLEGNRNIVIYSIQLGRVYRMIKVDSPPLEQCQNILDRITEDDEIDHCTEEDYEKLIQYYAGVMNGLFHSYMSVPLLRKVEKSFLKRLGPGIELKRPEKRRGKSLALCDTVLDIPDYAFLPKEIHNYKISCFMIELKAGSIARSYNNILSEELNGYTNAPRCRLSASNCFFCQNKSIRNRRNPGKKMSRYCPQELFSGNKFRMRTCLTNLLEDINTPRNKLRIFRDGVDETPRLKCLTNVRDLFSDDIYRKKSTDVLTSVVDLLIECLTHSTPVRKRHDSTLEQLANYSRESLNMPEGCILSVFANAQFYGASTVREVQSAYDELMAAIDLDDTVRTKLCVDGPYDTGLWSLGVRPDNPDGITDDVMSAFLIVRNYLTYRTAKDCSILVTFQQGRNIRGFQEDAYYDDDSVFELFDSTGCPTYRCRVAGIDFDPKPFCRMEKYLATEWKVYNNLRERL